MTDHAPGESQHISRRHFLRAVGVKGTAVTLGATAGRGRALAQALVHHLRSLQLAREWRRTKEPWVLAHVYAAHAFAMHFIQDVHSAGHAVTRAEDFLVADSRMRRHDYFGFRGVGMTFALAEGPCAAGAERASGSEGPCWTAFGDGNLGPLRSVDREHAAASTREGLERTNMVAAACVASVLTGEDPPPRCVIVDGRRRP